MSAGFEAGPPSARQLELALRALSFVMGSPTPSSTAELERALVEAWEAAGGRGRVLPLAQLPVITPSELAGAESSVGLRVQLVRLAVAAMLLDQRRDAARLARLEQLAVALEVDEPAIGDLRRWIRRQPLRLRRNLARRLWTIEEIERRAAQGGWRYVLRVALGVPTRLHTDDRLAARYQALAHLPPDSLGASLVAELRSSGFPLPGERGSLDDWMVRHDLVHVIAGIGTDPRSEVEAGTFMAGCRRRDGFTLIVFVLLQFHCGLRITPVARGERGLADPRRMLDALRRSAFMTIDPSLPEWDYERDFPLPLASVRARYGVGPASEPAPASTPTIRSVAA